MLVASASTVARATPGMNVSVTYTLKNRGGQAANNFDVGFSLVPQPSGAEIPLGPSRTGVSLIAGAMSPASTNTVTIPPGTALGSYKIKVTADASATVGEADESNNTLLTGTLSVLRPDLNVPTVTFTPAMIAPGGNISVSHAVKNLSPAPGNAGLSASRLLLSTDQTIAGQVADLGTVNVPSIVAGGMTTVIRSAQVPVGLAPGRYFVLAQADEADVILEQNPTNNLGASVARLVVGPDMTVTTASTVAGAIPGANVSVSYTLKNTGSATPAFNVGFVLVPVSPGPDVPIGPTRTAVVLATNGMLATSSIVGVPPGVAAGQYRIRVTADPADTVVEAVETNNAATTGIVTITPPELSIQSLSVPGTGVAGRSVGIPNTVVNTAAAPGTAPSFQVGLYLASSAVIDPGTDTLLVSRTVASLAPAATSAATTTVTLPTTPGNYFIGAVADRGGVVVEANEANNQMSGAIAVVPNMVRPSTTASAPDHAVRLWRGRQQRLGQSRRHVRGSDSDGRRVGRNGEARVRPADQHDDDCGLGDRRRGAQRHVHDREQWRRAWQREPLPVRWRLLAARAQWRQPSPAPSPSARSARSPARSPRRERWSDATRSIRRQRRLRDRAPRRRYCSIT